MGAKIVWSHGALTDLENLHAYIARDSEAIAAAFVGKILKSIDQLAPFPMIGPRIQERTAEPYRHLIVPPYRVVYRVANDRSAVILVRIVHGRRDLMAILHGGN